MASPLLAQRMGMVPASNDRQIAIETQELRPPAVAGPDPLVLLAISHPTMRALTAELLERGGGCRVRAQSCDDEELRVAIDRHHPHVVVIDTAQFPECCREALRDFPPGQMIVIGPEPGHDYRAAALAGGAGAWVARERVGDELIAAVRRVAAGRDPLLDRPPADNTRP